MLTIDDALQPTMLAARLARMWGVAGRKIPALYASFSEQAGRDHPGAPVFTVDGRYTARGWTEWTQGFQVGMALLAFDATGQVELLELARRATLQRMSAHVSHTGVHDHGFNIVSTFGNLWRLIREGRVTDGSGDLPLCELALNVSGAVQAARWTQTADGSGFIHSFNGPHSLFCDTIRSLRSLALAHQLGHVLMGENDVRISLLDRLIQHARNTARYSVYYGQGRDIYDIRGRVAHESIFNIRDGQFRCPSTQQGYSPFSTWMRGLAWIMLGYAEQLEFLASRDDAELAPLGGREEIRALMLHAARAACDFYLHHTPTDGVPYWDSGAPGLSQLGQYLQRPADPGNSHEPVDSSAAAIAVQGLLRMGHYLAQEGDAEGRRYWQAGLTVLARLLDEPYLCPDEAHQGLLLHAVYHRPRGWDHVPPGARVPQGESCLWGDYHLLEAGLYVERIIRGQPYYTFFGPGGAGGGGPG